MTLAFLNRQIMDLREQRAALTDRVTSQEATIKRLQEAYLPGNWERLHEVLAWNARLRVGLTQLRDDIIRNDNDTVWVGPCETACERITSILGDNWGEDGKCDPSPDLNPPPPPEGCF